MSLEDWRANGWLAAHQATPAEIRDTVAAAGADLADARKDISPAWRFAIAYNAALRLSTAALEASGYRAARDQKHYRTIAALPLILGAGAEELSAFLDGCRARRHDVTYETLSSVTDEEADELIAAAGELERLMRRWLRRRMPDAV